MAYGLLEWLDERQKTSTMEVETITLESLRKPWGMYKGNYCRIDGNFFQLIGIKITTTEREVKQWQQPMLEELGPTGIVAIIQEETTQKVLLAARQEPGNKSKGRVLLGPSFQASSANLQQVHGGKKPPLAEILDQSDVKVVVSQQAQDGGRYFEKKVDVRVIRITDAKNISHLVTPEHRWADMEEIKKAIMLGLCNPHLRDALLMMLASD